MTTITLEVGDELLSVLRQTGEPVERAALELIVLELYRRGAVSSGWAARRLGMDRVDFIRHGSELGIPYFKMTEEEWQAELRTVEELAKDPAVVADTSPLIALDRIGRLELLGSLFGRVLVPPAVVREYKIVPLPAWLEERDVARPLDPRVVDASLDPGEREAIALALAIDASRLLIDELPGRLFAQRLGIRVTGTVGVLILAKQAGLLTAIRQSLNELRATGFRMHPTLATEALRSAGETEPAGT